MKMPETGDTLRRIYRCPAPKCMNKAEPAPLHIRNKSQYFNFERGQEAHPES